MSQLVATNAVRDNRVVLYTDDLDLGVCVGYLLEAHGCHVEPFHTDDPPPLRAIERADALVVDESIIVDAAETLHDATDCIAVVMVALERDGEAPTVPRAAYDVVERPIDPSRWTGVLARACAQTRLLRRLDRLERACGGPGSTPLVRGGSARSERMLDRLDRLFDRFERARAATDDPPRRIVPLRELERAAIVVALEQCSGSVTEAAHRLGISSSTLYRRLKEFQIRPH